MFVVVVNNAILALQCPRLLVCHVTHFTGSYISPNPLLHDSTMSLVIMTGTFSSLTDPSTMPMSQIQSIIDTLLDMVFPSSDMLVSSSKHSTVVISTILYLFTDLCLEGT